MSREYRTGLSTVENRPTYCRSGEEMAQLLSGTNIWETVSSGLIRYMAYGS